MKTDIHPEYVIATVTCSCGNTFQTRSTKSELHVEICSQCHPFYTGKQKLMDTGGRVERFQRRLERAERAKLACEPAGAAAAAALLAGKVQAENPVVVVSGGNVSAETASAILGRR